MTSLMETAKGRMEALCPRGSGVQVGYVLAWWHPLCEDTV